MRYIVPYVQRRPSGYYYRQRVPNELQVLIGKTEIVLSLNTINEKTANTRAFHVLAVVRDLFGTAKQMTGDLSHNRDNTGRFASVNNHAHNKTEAGSRV